MMLQRLMETNPFLSNISKYRTKSSHDLVVAPAICVTVLLLINFPQAYNMLNNKLNFQYNYLLYQEQQ